MKFSLCLYILDSYNLIICNLNLFIQINQKSKIFYTIYIIRSTVPAREELALESLLEFSREPALMHDLYTNYDCDVQCTNLFDAIITALCMRAVPIGLQTHFETPSEMNMTGTSNGKEKEHGKDKDLNTETIKVDIMNRLALHGVLTILNAISGRDISYIQTSYGTSNSQQQQLQPPSHFQTTVPSSSSSSSPSSSGIIRPVATRPNQTNQTNQTNQKNQTNQSFSAKC